MNEEIEKNNVIEIVCSYDVFASLIESLGGSITEETKGIDKTVFKQWKEVITIPLGNEDYAMLNVDFDGYRPSEQMIFKGKPEDENGKELTILPSDTFYSIIHLIRVNLNNWKNGNKGKVNGKFKELLLMNDKQSY